MTLDYLDFELEIDQPTGQDYPLRVLHSPAGDARGVMPWPFGELALEKALLSSGGVRRTVLTSEEQTVQSFGAELFERKINRTGTQLIIEDHMHPFHFC